jgi:predicted phage tail protein
MSAPTSYNGLPEIHAASKGTFNAGDEKQIYKAAELISPRSGIEPKVATMSRVAVRLLNRETGKAMEATEIIAETLTQGTYDGEPVNAVAASVTINPTGNDNSVEYTADTKGTAGNGITIQYAISGSGSTVLSVAVTGTAILVTAGSACVASAVITAVNANAAAAALVTAAASGTVTGVIAAVAAKNGKGPAFFMDSMMPSRSDYSDADAATLKAFGIPPRRK